MRHEYTRTAVALAACLLAGGCETTTPYQDSSTQYPDGVPNMLRTNATSYDANGVVRLRLDNHTGRTVRYNLCRSKLEQVARTGEWSVVAESLAEVCTAELRTLLPGAAATYQFKLPYSRFAQYRVRTRLEDPVGRTYIEAVSNMFAIKRVE
jgi:hypothetical protein